MVWIVGVLFGVIAAAIHVYVPEQGLTFLWVMFATMMLGLWKRERPWRWMLLVVPLVPLADVIRKIEHPAGFAGGGVGRAAGGAGVGSGRVWRIVYAADDREHLPQESGVIRRDFLMLTS